QDGEIFGLMGYSGAGKSTLLRLINLLERPDSGKVNVCGQELTALNAAADPMRLLMLIPVVLLIYIAIKMRDALHAVTMATVAGLIIGLLTGVIEPSQIVRVENGSISGILTGGIANVSGIMLMCLALFGFTGVIEHAGLADATAKFLTNENQSPRRAEVTLAVATVFISTCLAAVTSVAVALAGQLADRLLRSSIDPYRRAYLLTGFANSIPVVLPFSAFSLITLSAASALGDPSLTPFSLMTATFYPIALFVVFSVSIATGIGRPKMSDEPQATDKA
ncbi:MAG: ATP-binding cassette domain-containing protein, partial [Sutterella wadsworthensis]|nr:ATP-binding cassette domain-containing protein [Sutterella wadsworthensis]